MTTIEKAPDRFRSALLELLGKSVPSFRKVRDLLDLHQLVHDGLPYQSLRRLQEELDSTQSEIADLLMMSTKTIQRRKQSKRLSSEESDRLVRVARLFTQAVLVFGDRERALSWLHAPVAALRGRRPWEFMDTDIGAEQLEELLGRIAYGVHS